MSSAGIWVLLILAAMGVGMLFAPIGLFFGLIGLSLFLWCWKRIGPYITNFARWTADWKNFIPLAITGTIYFIFIILLIILVPQALILWILMLLPYLAIAGVFVAFAGIVWVIAVFNWFWPRYRRFWWRIIASVWHLVPGKEGQDPGGTKGKKARPPVRPSPPGGRAVVAAERRQKSSMFSRFWALMLGKPSPAKEQKAVSSGHETTGQRLGPSGSTAAVPLPAFAPAEQARKRQPKRSLLGSFWDLMLGKPSKPRKRVVKPQGRPTGGDDTTAAAAAYIRSSAHMVETDTEAVQARKEKSPGFASRMWSRVALGGAVAKAVALAGVASVADKLRGRGKKDKAETKIEAGQAEKEKGPGFASRMWTRVALGGAVMKAVALAGVASVADKLRGRGKKDKAETKIEAGQVEKEKGPGFASRMWTRVALGGAVMKAVALAGVASLAQKVREAIDWIRVRLNLD